MIGTTQPFDMANKLKSKEKLIVALFRSMCVGMMALPILGCISVTTHTADGKKLVMSQEEFSKYVERVFRYHNQVMNDLIEAAEERGEQDPDEAEALSSAEATMIKTCRSLNEVVAESLSGKSVGLQTEMELVQTVPECEAASQVVDDLIP